MQVIANSHPTTAFVLPISIEKKRSFLLVAANYLGGAYADGYIKDNNSVMVGMFDYNGSTGAYPATCVIFSI